VDVGCGEEVSENAWSGVQHSQPRMPSCRTRSTHLPSHWLPQLVAPGSPIHMGYSRPEWTGMGGMGRGGVGWGGRLGLERSSIRLVCGRGDWGLRCFVVGECCDVGEGGGGEV
jgi:hypothetical protein